MPCVAGTPQGKAIPAEESVWLGQGDRKSPSCGWVFSIRPLNLQIMRSPLLSSYLLDIVTQSLGSGIKLPG